MQITKNSIVIMIITVTLYMLVDFVIFMNDMLYFWMIAMIQLGITILAVLPDSYIKIFIKNMGRFYLLVNKLPFRQG